MSSMQVVFLFDLNACADFLFSPKEELNRRLLSVRLTCLRLLCEFSSKYPNFKWGAKFFDSQGSKNQAMCKFVFTDFSLENFETFENEICVRYERHLSILQALLESSQNNVSIINNQLGEETNVVSPVKILQLALTQVLCEFQWETMDMWSPSYTKVKTRKRNFLFVFSDFKDNDESLHKFFGLNNSFSKPKFMNAFLPQSLHDSIMKKADIHLVLLNMCEDQKFMGPFSSKVLPLLSDTLHSINGSFIPMCILSQPLYNLKLLNDLERNFSQEKELMLSNLSTGYQNSFLPFSTVFGQSLHHSFYSNANTSVYDCCIDFTSKNIEIPIQIMEISNKNPDLSEDNSVKGTNLVKSKSNCTVNSTWSKFRACCVVPRGFHFPASKVLLCLSSSCELNSTFTCCGLQKLNKYLSSRSFNLNESFVFTSVERDVGLSISFQLKLVDDDDLNQWIKIVDTLRMLLECVTEDGKKLPGLLSSLSYDTATIYVFDPSIILKLGSEFPDYNSLTYENFQRSFLGEIKKEYSKHKDSFDKSKVIPKPFQIQSLEDKLEPQKFSLLSKTLNNSLKMEEYSNLLQQSVANRDLKSKSKRSSVHSNKELESNAVDQIKNTDEKSPDTVSNWASQMKYLKELPPDISYEELLSAIKDAYNSAIESSSITAITASDTIMKMVVNYCKKQDETSYQEHVSAMIKKNILMNEKDQRSITQKYEALDSKEAAEKIIKECQIQILLNLEVESLKLNPDKFGCVKTVTSLLNTAGFYFSQKEMFNLDGMKERRIFLNDVLKKKYGDNLHDIFEEFVHEFEDSESSPGSPAETISSEFNNEEELFSSVISSTLSEKSSSSTGSCKINNKEIKNKNTLERKLLRRRSDISDTARHRQILLPKSSPKKKKAKVAANKAIRYSPRLAAKRNENNKSTCEKTNKARRNLFAGDKACRTPKKNDNQSTPKSNKKNFVSKTKLAAETPAHKQNYSALQRRKSFMDRSNSPKVIAESPTIRKTAKDNANKELLEKLLKARQPSSTAEEQMPRPPSFNDHTPESKRRLSLKLFSKILNSPTARLGIKKCTKRLFDQISPQKSVESCKRFKASNESEDISNLFEKS